MREHPIIFSGSMVRATLEDRKTMTRRVVKPQPEEGTDCPYHVGAGEDRKARICPYGVPEDRLWVRETFASVTIHGFTDTHGEQDTEQMIYRADEWKPTGKGYRIKWTPSIYMRRHESRLTFEIVSIRVERLQEITEEDAKKEGTQEWYPDPRKPNGAPYGTNKRRFQDLWDSLNGKKYPWSSNPWVWVIEFRRIKP